MVRQPKRRRQQNRANRRVGHIHGKVTATGTKTTKKNEKGATVEINGQANAIDALGWTPATNPNDISITLNSIDNRRSAKGEAELQGAVAGVHGNVSSFGSANGISVVALADFGKAVGVDGSSGATGKSGGGRASINEDEDDLLGLTEGDEDAERPAKNTDHSDMYGKTLKTSVARVHNSGEISGQIRQISGNNNGYNSPHLVSTAEATGSGNGINLHSDTFNAQIPRVETRLGQLHNRGRISGDAYLKAGDGSGDLSVTARASGNGVSVYQATGNASLTALDNVNNEGIIKGHIETRPGTIFTSAQRGQTIPEERARLIVSDEKTITDYYKPNPIPEQPAAAGNDNYGNFATFRAESDIRASGNGISVQYASGVGADVNSGASLGNIDNSGVISGYSENYHGYARGYGRVSTLNSGAGIATDRKITNPINNRGIISGNHAAILSKGRVDDSRSISVRAGVSDNIRKGKNDVQSPLSIGCKW